MEMTHREEVLDCDLRSEKVKSQQYRDALLELFTAAKFGVPAQLHRATEKAARVLNLVFEERQ